MTVSFLGAVVVAGVVILVVVFAVVAPMIKNAGKKKRGPSSRR